MTLVLLPAGLILAFRFVPPPVTPLMLLRLAEGDGLERRWIALSDVSPAMISAVVAAEDSRFCRHSGFDWGSIRAAWADYRETGRIRGASTISMQTARSLLLWPGRNAVRKALELYLTLLIEAAWDKRRILEVYLNVAEWGRGRFGVEAAARRAFGRSAAAVSAEQAALLAALLPDPRGRSAGSPSAGVARYARTIAARARQAGPLLDCL